MSKYKYLFYYIYIFILLVVPCSIFMHGFNSTTINVNYKTKILKSINIGNNITNLENIQLKENEIAMASPVGLNVVKNNVDIRSIGTNLIPKLNFANAKYTDVLETQVGKLTAYGPDCPGCGGKVSWGQDVRNGNIYYNDSTYGRIRILAGDRRYPFGTIVRISNSRYGAPFYAVILDRGGNVGFGKGTLFDLLFASSAEAGQFGTSKSCTFEIMRYGF